ncbi:arginine--tRNA ligase [Mycoplasma sp. 5912]
MTLTQLIKAELINIVKKLQESHYFDVDFNADDLNFILGEPNLPVKTSSVAKRYDLSTNLAFVLKAYKKINPMKIAECLVEKLANSFKFIYQVDIAPPGFLNIVLNDSAFIYIISNILEQKSLYAKNQVEGQKINVEYISANPTGFLHVGHVRGAVFGSTLINVLRHIGYNVESEYYINDAGNQINILVNSLYVHYAALFGKNLKMSDECYQGNDIIWVAQQVKESYNDYFLDLNTNKRSELENLAVEILLNKIKDDLAKLNIHIDTFTSENSLYEQDMIKPVLEKLAPYTYLKDGALFLKTSDFGDDKDRVLIKSDASNTYLLPDIAYHLTKIKKASRLINIWGADHSGYVARMKIAFQCLGYNPKNLEVLIIQLVRLIKDGSEFKMSKRAGTSVTLADLLDVSSSDAIRFMMLTREISNKFDFDIDYANSNDTNNPVFLVQYTYSRIVSLLKKIKKPHLNNTAKFTDKAKKIIITLDLFSDLIKTISVTSKVNLLSQYLLNLVKLFNSFYEQTYIQTNEQEESYAAMIESIRIVMKIALDLMGVNAPEQM